MSRDLQKETVESDGRHSTEMDCLAISFFPVDLDTVFADKVKDNGMSDAKLWSSKTGWGETAATPRNSTRRQNLQHAWLGDCAMEETFTTSIVQQ